ncbi:hypothetical protein [Aliikangiella coralliicola]|uniref:DNA-directed DNA polymerase n=1 Tax=Aliikangiella coralliicola TaxID=2592383 RepID=A0A545UD46_9GAMM|nr:hypothetical protein [Aliikangiella coralliicola]TQV87394.1 hypothetical protein FLL46_13190 [Aliikangiella coralliicola]
MLTADLPWFKHCFEHIESSYRSGRLAHGILVAAPDGSGKTIFAETLVKSLFCRESHSQLASPCNQCKSCHLIDAGTHPDFHLVERLVDNKGKQKSSIGIDQIRQLTAKLTDQAQLDGWRVALITSVSAMTTASFNALLKTLEEPGDKTLLILLCDNLQKVPATIRSRCQILQPELKTSISKPWIMEKAGESEAVVSEALRNCYNAPLSALNYIQQDGHSTQQSLYQSLDQVLQNQLTPSEFLQSVPVSDNEMWDALGNYFYSASLLAMGTNKEQLNRANYQQLPDKLIFNLYSKIVDYKRAQFSGSNLQSKLQLQAILIQWFEAGRKIINISKA